MALTKNFKKTITFLPIDNDCFIEKLKEKSKSEVIIIENAYHKIKQVSGNKNKIKIEIGIYDNPHGRLLDTRSYEFKPDISDSSENFLKQGYEFLKTLEEYQGYQDC